MGIVIRLAISAVAVWIATLVVPGIRVFATTVPGRIGTIILVAVIFGLVNTVLRPIIKTVGCAVYILTLGLIALVVNGALFMLTSWIAGKLNLPFHVDHFWPSAMVGALLVGVTSWLLNLLVPDGDDD
jgi:putative membrane protein